MEREKERFQDIIQFPRYLISAPRKCPPSDRTASGTLFQPKRKASVILNSRKNEEQGTRTREILEWFIFWTATEVSPLSLGFTTSIVKMDKAYNRRLRDNQHNFQAQKTDQNIRHALPLRQPPSQSVCVLCTHFRGKSSLNK